MGTYSFFQKSFLLLVFLTYAIADNEDGLEGPFCPGETPYSFNDKKSCCDFPVDPFDPYCDGKEVTCPYDLGCENCEYLDIILKAEPICP